MKTTMLALFFVMALAGPVAARDQAPTTAYTNMAPIEQYLIEDRQAEIALARSAAPASIAKDATVLVLTRRGYETAVQGNNGFVCLVDRGWQAPFGDADFWNPKVRAPTCLNPQAARSVLPMQHKRTELPLAGKSKDQIMAHVMDAVEKKQFTGPEIGAMFYMMSKQQYLADRFGHWHPHVMFYLPGTVKGSDWGANLPKSPVMVSPEQLPDGRREPVLVFIVQVGHWSDETPAPAHDEP